MYKQRPYIAHRQRMHKAHTLRHTKKKYSASIRSTQNKRIIRTLHAEKVFTNTHSMCVETYTVCTFISIYTVRIYKYTECSYTKFTQCNYETHTHSTHKTQAVHLQKIHLHKIHVVLIFLCKIQLSFLSEFVHNKQTKKSSVQFPERAKFIKKQENFNKTKKTLFPALKKILSSIKPYISCKLL